MRNSLATLGRIKKFELDEQQRLLVAELEHEENLTGKLKSLIAKYEEEKEFVAQNPGICDFGLYTDQYLKKRRALEKQLHETQVKIEKYAIKWPRYSKNKRPTILLRKTVKPSGKKNLPLRSRRCLMK